MTGETEDNETGIKPVNPRANRRPTGKNKRARGIISQQIPWRDDPVIIERVRIGRIPYMERRSEAESVRFIREWQAANTPDEPPISLSTMREDRKRFLELSKQDIENARAEHIAEVDYLIAGSFDRLDRLKDTSQNVTGLTNAILTGIKTKGQLDGSLKEGPQQTTVHIDHIDVVVTQLMTLVADPTEVLALIERVKLQPDRTDIIDAQPGSTGRDQAKGTSRNSA